MEQKKNILEELKNEAPFLSEINRKNHFLVPRNYFEVLPEIVSCKKLNNNYLNLFIDKLSHKYFTPIAAAVILFIVVFKVNTYNISTELTSDQLSELIIEDDYFEMDDYLVYEAYTEILEEAEKETSSDEDEYINYLIENNIDINSIIEEL
tara:strand:+ start:10184 stop:10636 length:453 start_codon:yes stop_codon:yes gene_type:complete